MVIARPAADLYSTTVGAGYVVCQNSPVNRIVTSPLIATTDGNVNRFKTANGILGNQEPDRIEGTKACCLGFAAGPRDDYTVVK
jgi:hypothetical protein